VVDKRLRTTVLNKDYKTHDNGLWRFFACETWFGNAPPKVMKTAFKAILLIIIHTVEGFVTVHDEN